MIWSAPVELFCEIAMDVRQRSPFAYTLYFGYTNGWLGYLPDGARLCGGRVSAADVAVHAAGGNGPRQCGDHGHSRAPPMNGRPLIPRIAILVAAAGLGAPPRTCPSAAASAVAELPAATRWSVSVSRSPTARRRGWTRRSDTRGSRVRRPRQDGVTGTFDDSSVAVLKALDAIDAHGVKAR